MNPNPLVHVVDDDASMLSALLLLLKESGYQARGYGSTGEILLEPLPDRPGCLLLDVHLPGPVSTSSPPCSAAARRCPSSS